MGFVHDEMTIEVHMHCPETVKGWLGSESLAGADVYRVMKRVHQYVILVLCWECGYNAQPMHELIRTSVEF